MYRKKQESRKGFPVFVLLPFLQRFILIPRAKGEIFSLFE